MQELLREAMEAGACGFSAQLLGQNSVQRDYDGTPMITDIMAKEDLYAFGSVLAELGYGSIQCAGPSQKTTENLAKSSGGAVASSQLGLDSIPPELRQRIYRVYFEDYCRFGYSA